MLPGTPGKGEPGGPEPSPQLLEALGRPLRPRPRPPDTPLAGRGGRQGAHRVVPTTDRVEMAAALLQHVAHVVDAQRRLATQDLLGPDEPGGGVADEARELKDGLGVDHFEGRSYTGWHRHVTLAALAQAFCTHLRNDPKAPAPA